MKRFLFGVVALLSLLAIPSAVRAQVSIQFRDNTGAILATYPSGGCSGSGCTTVIFKEDASQSIVFDPVTNTVVFTASGASGAAFYQIVQANGSSSTQRTKLNFLPPVTTADNSGNDSTDVTVPLMAEGTTHNAGLAADPGATPGTTKYLREDNSYAVPPGSGSSGGVITKTGGYTAATGDSGKLISVNDSGANSTIDLPATPPSAQWYVSISNSLANTGYILVRGNGNNVDGVNVAIILYPGWGITAYTDGTVYYTNRGEPTPQGGNHTIQVCDMSLLGSICVLTGVTALPNNTTATTQSPGDNSTKVATTAYIDSVLPISETATLTPGTSVTSTTCVTAACTNLRGTVSIVGGTATTGTVLAITWASTGTAYVCRASINWNSGTTVDLGVGNDVATTTGVNVTVATSITGLTLEVNYSCQP